ncbi:hypothetical protein ABBQ38_005853 [Trebouxia sp. C0009 RCD-2024]
MKLWEAGYDSPPSNRQTSRRQGAPEQGALETALPDFVKPPSENGTDVGSNQQSSTCLRWVPHPDDRLEEFGVGEAHPQNLGCMWANPSVSEALSYPGGKTGGGVAEGGLGRI